MLRRRVLLHVWASFDLVPIRWCRIKLVLVGEFTTSNGMVDGQCG